VPASMLTMMAGALGSGAPPGGPHSSPGHGTGGAGQSSSSSGPAGGHEVPSGSYAGGRATGALPPGYIRMAAYVYWHVVRLTCGTVVEFLERAYPGNKEDGVYLSLFQQATACDAILKAAFDAWGEDGVQWALENDTAVEIGLNAIAVDWDAQLHGDTHAAASLLAAKPAGMTDMLPTWALEKGRNVSKALYQQSERVGNSSSSVVPGGQRTTGWLTNAAGNRTAATKRRAAKAKGKAKAKAKAAATGAAEEH
jgi:hypothetical protein